MTDHFFWDDDPTYEAWTTMAFLAAHLPNYQIGPIVLGQGYRNPALTAKMAATLQSLSGGRFVLALGAGWKEDEYRGYGYDFPSPRVRVEQLEDTLEIIHRLWTQPGKVTYHGKHYRIDEAYCEPKPDPLPLILVGGGGEKTMRLAVRFANIWNLPDCTAAVYAERLAILHRHCADLGRDPSSLRLSWFGRLAVGQTIDQAQALVDSRWNTNNAVIGTPDSAVKQIQALADLGVDHFIFMVMGLTDRKIIKMVMDDVLPRVKPLGS